MSGKGSISRMSDECLITLETVFSYCIDCQTVMRKFTLAGKTNITFFILGKLIICSDWQYRTASSCDHLCSQNPFALKKIILLYILEISVGVNFQFSTCRIICHDDSMGMHLQAADSPHVVHSLFNAMLQGTSFVVTIHHDHHLLGIHDGAYTNSQCGLGDFIYIVIEETTVGDDGIGGEGLLAGTAGQA